MNRRTSKLKRLEFRIKRLELTLERLMTDIKVYNKTFIDKLVECNVIAYAEPKTDINKIKEELGL